MTALAEELAEARKADTVARAVELERAEAAEAAEFEQTVKFCRAHKLQDRELCLAVGVELP